MITPADVIHEIVHTPYDEEIVFDLDLDEVRYLALRELMWNAGSDHLVLVPPIITVTKVKNLIEFPPYCLGEAFGRYFVHGRTGQ